MLDFDCRIEHFGAVVLGGRAESVGMAGPVGVAIAPNEPNLARFRLQTGSREENEANLARIRVGATWNAPARRVKQTQFHNR